MIEIKETANGYAIDLTRGDTLILSVSPVVDGKPYEAEDGDVFKFALSRGYGFATPLIIKNVPTDTMVLYLSKEETKTLNVNDKKTPYVFEIEFTSASGYRETFIKGTLNITHEVD